MSGNILMINGSRIMFSVQSLRNSYSLTDLSQSLEWSRGRFTDLTEEHQAVHHWLEESGEKGEVALDDDVDFVFDIRNRKCPVLPCHEKESTWTSTRGTESVVL